MLFCELIETTWLAKDWAQRLSVRNFEIRLYLSFGKSLTNTVAVSQMKENAKIFKTAVLVAGGPLIHNSQTNENPGKIY